MHGIPRVTTLLHTDEDAMGTDKNFVSRKIGNFRLDVADGHHILDLTFPFVDFGQSTRRRINAKEKGQIKRLQKQQQHGQKQHKHERNDTTNSNNSSSKEEEEERRKKKYPYCPQQFGAWHRKLCK